MNAHARANPQRPALVYGFGPYAEFEHNITIDVIATLPSRPDLVTHVFETRFERVQFENCVSAHNPGLIIGLGQHRHARKLRLERRAVNTMGRRGAHLKRIDRDGPPSIAVNLALPTTPATTVTYDAGTYVCNFSMYVMLQYCLPRGIPYAFIHIPRRFSVAAVARYLENALARYR